MILNLLYILISLAFWVPMFLIGVVALIPLAVFHAWHWRPGKTPFSDRKVTAWDPVAMAGLVGVTATVYTIALFGHGHRWLALFVFLSGIVAVVTDVYDNEEDGIVPPPSVNGQPYLQSMPAFVRAYIWSAWRNNVNNQRFWPGNFVILAGRPARSCWGPFTMLTCDSTHGPRICVYVGKLFRFGWLINVDADTGRHSYIVFENLKGVVLP